MPFYLTFTFWFCCHPVAPQRIFTEVLNLFLSLQAICTEAGLMALRERRMKVTNEDFKKSKENVLYKKQEGTPEGLYL